MMWAQNAILQFNIHTSQTPRLMCVTFNLKNFIIGLYYNVQIYKMLPRKRLRDCYLDIIIEIDKNFFSKTGVHYTSRLNAKNKYLLL